MLNIEAYGITKIKNSDEHACCITFTDGSVISSFRWSEKDSIADIVGVIINKIAEHMQERNDAKKDLMALFIMMIYCFGLLIFLLIGVLVFSVL